jgi:hypothetical protein
MPQTVVVERAKAADRKREAQEAESTTATVRRIRWWAETSPVARLSSDRHFSEYATSRELTRPQSITVLHCALELAHRNGTQLVLP